MSDSGITYPIKSNSDPEVPLVMLLVYIGVILVAFLLVFKLASAIISNTKAPVEQVDSPSSIQVSAQVMPALGLKIIGSDSSRAVAVSGNYRRGFVIIDSNGGQPIYNSDKIPGSGVVVRLESSSTDFMVMPKY